MSTLRVRAAALLALLLLTVPSAALGDQDTPTDGVWPLRPPPSVVAAFDPPATTWGSGHRGVDLAGHVGAAVHSALAGRVSFAGSLAGRGVVVVDHGSRRTTYEPVTATIAVGDRVAAGTVVGRLQLFGSHCFPRACLHWGLIEGRRHYLDPLTLVGAAPVRLLPLDGWVPGPVGPVGHVGPVGLFPAPAGVPGWTPLRPQARGWAWR